MNDWKEILKNLENLSNPESIKSIYIESVKYLSEHPVSKGWKPRIDNHFFFRLNKSGESKMYLTFESPDAYNLFFGIVKSMDGKVIQRQNLNTIEFEKKLNTIIEVMNT